MENSILRKRYDDFPTLRDQFAMAALTGIIAQNLATTPGGKVDAAYTYADLMLMRKAEDDKQD